MWMIVVLRMIQLSSGLTISEVMYDPAQSDSEYEWVELYSDELINLTGWYIDGKHLHGTHKGYIVIARNKNSFLSMYNISNVIEVKISLKNSGDTINITNGSETIIYTYEDNYAENHSIALCDDKEKESSEPSPGRENPECLWTECSVQIIRNGTISKRAAFKIIAQKSAEINITLHGRIINMKNKTIKSYTPYTNRLLKSSSIRNYNSSIDPGAYIISFNLSMAGCSAYDEELLYVPIKEMPSESYVIFSETPKLKPGLNVVKVNVYKGNTAKTKVTLSLGKMESKMYMKQKYSNITLNMPLILDETVCSSNEKLMLSGLGDSSTTRYNTGCSVGFDAKVEHVIGKLIHIKTIVSGETNVIVQSFVYRGRKHYSEHNVSAYAGYNQSLSQVLPKPKEAGEYRVKTRIWRHKYKTPREFVTVFSIDVDDGILTKVNISENKNTSGTPDIKKRGETQMIRYEIIPTGRSIIEIYENKGEQKYIPYVISIGALSLCGAYVLKKI